MNEERDRSRLGRLHVEAFQDTFDVVGLRQEKLSFFGMSINLHSKYVSCQTDILHGKLQPQFPNEFGELSGMPTSGRVATIAYIREPTAGAYGTDFISSPSELDVGQSR